MLLDEIRTTFSKGNLVLSGGLLVVIYPSGRWTTQSVRRGESQRVFEAMIESCRAMRWIIEPTKGFHIVFDFDDEVSTGQVYFQAIEREPTLEELKASMGNDGESEDALGFFRGFFDGVPLDDGAQVLESFSRFLDEKARLEDTGVSNLSVYQRWNALERESKVFRRYAGVCEVEYLPPEPYSHSCGVLSYTYDSTSRRVIEWSGEKKEALLRLTRLSDGVDLESGGDDLAVLTFSVGAEPY